MPRKKKVATKPAKKSARISSRVTAKKSRPTKAKTSTSKSRGKAGKAKIVKVNTARVKKIKKPSSDNTVADIQAQIIILEKKLLQANEKVADQTKKTADKANALLASADKKYKVNIDKFKKALAKPATTAKALSQIAKLKEVVAISSMALKAAKNDVITAKFEADVAANTVKFSKKAVVAQNKAKKAVLKDEKEAKTKVIERVKKEKEKVKKEAEKMLKEAKVLSGKQNTGKKPTTSSKKTAPKKVPKSTSKSKSSSKPKKKTTTTAKKSVGKPTKKAVLKSDVATEETATTKIVANAVTPFSEPFGRTQSEFDLASIVSEPASSVSSETEIDINGNSNFQEKSPEIAELSIISDFEEEENNRSLFSPVDDL